MDKLRIIIADDNLQFREGLKFYIENIMNHHVIAEAKNGDEVLSLPNLYLADIFLLDISMPRLNGIETAKKLLTIHAGYKIIAITSFEERTYINELIEAGIKGCVLKKDIYEHLKYAIARVMMNELYFPKNINLMKQ